MDSEVRELKRLILLISVCLVAAAMVILATSCDYDSLARPI